MTAMLRVHRVSFAPPVPRVRPKPAATEVPPQHVTLPGSGAGDLAVNNPVEIVPTVLHEIKPGACIAHCESAAMIVPDNIPERIVIVPPVAHGTALPAFAGRSRVPGML